MTETYITCEEVITVLLAYLARELTPEKEHEFERHLSVCPSCVAYIETYRTAVELGKAVLCDPGEAALPVECSRELTRALLDARRRATAGGD